MEAESSPVVICQRSASSNFLRARNCGRKCSGECSRTTAVWWVIISLTVTTSLLFSNGAIAANTDSSEVEDAQVEVVEGRDKPLEDFLHVIWARLEAFGLGNDEVHVTDNVVVTAGIRGRDDDGQAENTLADTAVENTDVRREVRGAYMEAIQTARDGNREGLDDFLTAYDDSALVPNVLLAIASFDARAGNTERSIAQLDRFLELYPSHQLADKVRSLRDRLED